MDLADAAIRAAVYAARLLLGRFDQVCCPGCAFRNGGEGGTFGLQHAIHRLFGGVLLFFHARLRDRWMTVVSGNAAQRD
jgi:hypothetical protein